MNVHFFGDLDGTPVLEVEIASKAGARAKIITYGASVRDLVIPHNGGHQRVVMGLNSVADYHAYASHMGAIAGRFANRIANGRFELDGQSYQLPLNQNGKNSLHGGGNGFGKRPWKLQSHDASSVTLTLHSPDGEAGYPGNLDVTCVYSLEEPATLQMELHATCDKATVLNLAHHSYFNLDGSPDILGHELCIPSRFRTPTDADLIPTGEVVNVTGTPWDFQKQMAIGTRAQPYDANYLIEQAPDPATGLALAAFVRSPRNGLTMTVTTTEPCVQFYDAAKMNCPVPGLDGAHYGPYAGLCLEPQHVPDSPNRRYFPSAVLRKGETYRQLTRYAFA
ncbi:MAG: galactose mutarotase [Hyphomicrobiales bacterium]|nr:galactose mutarotase [Hyphomicrobiales bacterium]MDE2114513.1 galactose mutarotase [Hyphomicrobiales bacterium]